MTLREAAVSRSLDNITVLILGLKGLKRTVKQLNSGKTLQQIRQQSVTEQMNVPHTYSRDFFEVEVNETDLFNSPAPSEKVKSIDEEIFSSEGREQPETNEKRVLAAAQAPSQHKTTNKI